MDGTVCVLEDFEGFVVGGEATGGAFTGDPPLAGSVAAGVAVADGGGCDLVGCVDETVADDPWACRTTESETTEPTAGDVAPSDVDADGSDEVVLGGITTIGAERSPREGADS